MLNESLSREPAPWVPSYRRHKPTGQAVTTLNGRDIYLGKWNSKASRAEYDRLIGEWLAGGRCLPKRFSCLTCFAIRRASVSPLGNHVARSARK